MIIGLILVNPQRINADTNNNMQAIMPQLTIITNSEEFTKSSNDDFFDIEFKPGDKVILGIQVQNISDKKIEVEVTPGTVITNQGQIVYGDQSNKMIDKSNRYPFSKMVKKQTVSIEANSSLTVKIPVDVPKEKFDGTILGNIAFTVLGQDQMEKSKKTDVATISNVIRQAIVVRLTQGHQPDPNFEIGSPATSGTTNGPTITIPVRNTAATYFKSDLGTKVNYVITKKDDSSVKYTNVDKNISMAPNSFYYGVVSTNGKAIKPGKYNAKISIKYKGKETKFSRDFDVTIAQAKNLNKSTPKITKKRTSFLNYVILAVIFIIILIMLIALYTGIIRAKKKARKNKKRPYRTLRKR